MEALTANLQNTLQWVQTNPLIVTLMSGGAIVWLFSNIKTIWKMIVNAINACISFNIYNTYEDNRGTYTEMNVKIRQVIFNNFLTNAKTIWERTVNLDLSANADMSFNVANDAAKAALEDKPHQATSYAEIHEKAVTNTYGFSIKIIFGKLCFVNRGYKQDGMKIIVNTTVKVFFARKKKFMKKLEQYIRKT